MRTVLDKQTRAFEAGFRAHEAGTSRDSNPHTDADLRSAWFDGWDYATQCNGECTDG